MIYDVKINEKIWKIELSKTKNGWQYCVDDRKMDIDLVKVQDGVLSLILEGKAYEIRREILSTGLQLWIRGNRYVAEVRDPRSFRSRRSRDSHGDGPQNVLASMPGKVVRILVAEKQEVEAGQGILTIEAMKMQNELKSPKKGIVQRIAVSAGTSVNAGDILAIIE